MNRNKINFFCINLEHRNDRWSYCKKIFATQNLHVTRWNATPLPENRRFWAWLSHREIIELAKKKNMDYVGVFEDDIEFLVDDFKYQCEQAILSLKNCNWYILYFGGLIWTWGELQKHHTWSKLLQVKGLFEAHAVVYHKNFYDIYLKKHPSEYSSEIYEYYLDNKYTAFDQWYAGVVQFEYPCYITNKILVTQRDDFSSIENKNVIRYKKSIYRFYVYKYMWSRIATFLDKCWSKMSRILRYLR